MMDRVGGFDALLALEEDGHRYDLMEYALAGEAEAKQIAAMKERAHGG